MRIFSKFPALRALCLVVLLALFVAPTASFAQAAPPAQQETASGSSGGFFDFFTNPPSMQEQLEKYKGTFSKMPCWSCAVFTAFGSQVFVKGEQISKSAGGPMTSVLAAFGSLFALFYLGSGFVSGDASGLLERWKVFWKLCIAVAAGSAVLQVGAFDFAWDYIYGPLSAIPLAVAEAFGGGSASGCSPNAVVSGAPSGASAMASAMGGIVCGGHKISMEGLGVATALMFSGDGIVGTLVNVVTGFILAIVFIWIAISFPLRFIDVLLRLMVVGVVAPVLVVCAVFKPTRSLVKLGISNLLYAANTFAFTSIMFSLGYQFFMDQVASSTQDFGFLNATTGEALMRAVTLIGSGVVFAAMLRMAQPLAAEFSQFSGQSGGVGDAASGAASSTVSMAVKGGVAAGAAVAGGGMVARSIGNAVEQGAAKGLGKGVT